MKAHRFHFSELLLALTMFCFLSPVLAAPPSPAPVEASRAPFSFALPHPRSFRNEVIGGKPTADRKIVGIHYIDNGSVGRVCSGLWISRRFVLTAAHCTCNNSSNSFLVSNDTVAANDWRPATLHKRYDESFCAFFRPREGNDLALLALNSGLLLPAKVNERPCDDYSLIDDIKLASTYILAPPARLLVAGYGFVGDMPGSLGQRREAEVGVNTLTCAQPLAQALGCTPLKEIILGAGRTDGEIRDTCGGDSGGPTYLRQGDRLMPVGIVSRGLPIAQVFPNRGLCGSGGIYTLLGRKEVIAWLRDAGVPSGTQC
ncbi:trypsin-like serine protease [uncultured Bradyrhizobium sp.]|uniref:trypsin-like serine protease n=1 Tax=uncultured Bradyrhizobium sp. TaxID=199684 RepID=UPI0035CB5219